LRFGDAVLVAPVAGGFELRGELGVALDAGLAGDAVDAALVGVRSDGRAWV